MASSQQVCLLLELAGICYVCISCSLIHFGALFVDGHIMYCMLVVCLYNVCP